jgi:hypothetical protein
MARFLYEFSPTPTFLDFRGVSAGARGFGAKSRPIACQKKIGASAIFGKVAGAHVISLRLVFVAGRFVFFQHGRPRRAALPRKEVARMIAPRKKARPLECSQAGAHWHGAFLKMLPMIQKRARIAFRHMDREGDHSWDQQRGLG